MRTGPLPEDEGDQRRESEDEGDQARRPGVLDGGVRERSERDRDEDGADDVEGLVLGRLRLGDVAQRNDDDKRRDGDIDEEDEAPADAVDQPASEERTD